MIESGALEQAYAKLETTYAVSAVTGGEALSSSDAIRHQEMTINSKKNREVSKEKRGTPDAAQSLPRRQTQGWTLPTILWEPSGSLGTPSNVAKFLKAAFGSQHAITSGLATLIAASPAPTAGGASLDAVTGLSVGDLAVVTMPDGTREITKVKTIGVTTGTPPTAAAAALAGAGAGNVENGTHSYRVVFVSASGDSQAGTVSNTVTVVDKTANGKVSLTAIQVGPAGTTARKIYRTAAGNAVTGPWKLLTTIADNTTLIYEDNTADASLTTTLSLVYAVTFYDVSTAPDAADAFVAGVTFTQTSLITDSLSLYKYYNAGGFAQAGWGCVVEQLVASFDGTMEVKLNLSGPAGRYADNSTGTIQAKPAAHTTLGSPVGGMVGHFHDGTSRFEVLSVEITQANMLELRNRELGTAWASGIAGRTDQRNVRVKVRFWLEDLGLIDRANNVSRGTLRLLVGDTNGSMVGAFMPSVEFEIPDVDASNGLKEVEIEGYAYAVAGNDALTMGEL